MAKIRAAQRQRSLRCGAEAMSPLLFAETENLPGLNAGSASGFEFDRAALTPGFELLPLLGKSIHCGSARRVFPEEGALLVNGPASIGRFDHEVDHPTSSASSDALATN